MQLPIAISINRQRLLARLLCRGNIARLALQSDGQVSIERHDGTQALAGIAPGTTVYSRLVMLRLRIDGRVESVVLPRSATGDDAHRRLRVWLKWKASVLA